MNIYIIYNDDFSKDDNIEKGEIDNVGNALTSLGHFVAYNSIKSIADFDFFFSPFLHGDLVFNLFEGFSDHPESEILAVEKLEELSLLFTGNSSKTLKLTLDKCKTKKLLEDCGVRTPNFTKVTSNREMSLEGLSFPLIIKPNRSDASNGIDLDNVTYRISDLVNKVNELLFSYDEVVIEEYIDGREFNVGLLGRRGEMKVTSISEIVYDFPVDVPKILTFGSKWKKDSMYFDNSSPVCPAVVDVDKMTDICDMAIKSCAVAECKGYARVDFRQDREGNNYVLEINANPDLSDDAGFVLQAKQFGLSYDDLIGEIVRIGIDKR